MYRNKHSIHYVHTSSNRLSSSALKKQGHSIYFYGVRVPEATPRNAGVNAKTHCQVVSEIQQLVPNCQAQLLR